MLRQLYIKNFTLIDELNIEFCGGFSVITGETGAGKSIILGALGLLLGQRADSKSIKMGADRCVIEAHFDLTRYDLKPFFDQNDIDYDSQDCIVRRELTASGKSRAFINDIPVTLSQLKELGEQLVDIHSQHQNLLLSKQDFQLSVVDTIAGDADLLSDYSNAFSAYQNACRKLDELRQEIALNSEKADFLRFQFEELEQARLVDGEQEELEQKSEAMEHSEDIKTALYAADNALQAENTGIITQLRSSASALRDIERVVPAAEELAERIQSSYIELKDIGEEISSMLEHVDFDPAELDSVNARLDRIYDLEKKHHVSTVGELIGIYEELKRQLSNIDDSDQALADAEKEVAVLRDNCGKIAAQLSSIRCKAAKKIEKEMLTRLVPLGMPHVKFEVSVAKTQLNRNGADAVDFLFSANTSTPLQPVAQVASGGEIARVMLSLKAMISGAVKLPTIIFDEIDTGVSGKIAEQMGQIMYEMGQCERQVISITHLPQIAARGTSHYKVFKEEGTVGTISRMKLLSADERVAEIAQMLSGSDVSEAARENARELLRIK